VRAGLLVAGAAVAVIGVGVLLASLSFSTGPMETQFDPISVSTVAGHSFFSQQLTGVNRSSASISLVWSSSRYLNVNVYSSEPCPHLTGVCASGTPVAFWWGDSGRWSTSGSLSFPLFLNLSNPNGTTATFTGILLESYTTSALANPTWNLFLPLTGGVVLIAIGGVAVFLGLFLPKGVYTRPPGPPGEYDEDDGDDDLDGGEIDAMPDDDGPPPQGHS
jgi:hypothetical protein